MNFSCEGLGNIHSRLVIVCHLDLIHSRLVIVYHLDLIHLRLIIVCHLDLIQSYSLTSLLHNNDKVTACLMAT